MKQTLRPLNVSLGRPGIALMVTVGIMALIAVVILGNLKLVDDAMKQTKLAQTMNQDQAMFKSFSTLLKKQAAQVQSPEALDSFLLSVPSLSDDKGIVELGVDISSLQGKININAIFEDDNQTIAPYYESMFFRMFEAYNIKDGHQLLALIADTIDEDNNDRYTNSELVNRYVDISQGMIVNLNHLHKLLTFYDAMIEDENVYKIPWDDFFRFGEPYIPGILDCNYMKRDLARFMGLKVATGFDHSYLSCDEIGDDQNRSKSDFHMESFSEKKPYYVRVKSAYRTLNLSGEQSFIFEIKSKEISHFKSY